MVKQQKKNNRKKQSSKGFTANSAKARKINASTEYETCDEQLSPFGGLLAVIKFFDLLPLWRILSCKKREREKAGQQGNDYCHVSPGLKMTASRS